MSERNENRIPWVDTAKGLGVYLVILGHLWYVCIPSIVNQAIYSFHMPMFFALSGFVFVTSRKPERFSAFILSKIKRLLIPTAFYIVAFAIISIFLKMTELNIQIIPYLFYLFGKCFNDPCWFFITLFEIYVVMYLIRIRQAKPVVKIAAMLIFAFAGYFVYTKHLIPYFGIDRAIIASFFFIAGTVARDIYESKILTKAKHILIFGFSLIMFAIFGLYINGKITFYDRYLDHYFAFLISGIFGSIFFCYVCRFITHYRIAEYLKVCGNNSLFIVGTHYILTQLFRKAAIMLKLANTWYVSILAILFTILLVEIYRHVCRFLDIHCPILTGKTKNKIKHS